jgi:hypothetical protein
MTHGSDWFPTKKPGALLGKDTSFPPRVTTYRAAPRIPKRSSPWVNSTERDADIPTASSTEVRNVLLLRPTKVPTGTEKN